MSGLSNLVQLAQHVADQSFLLAVFIPSDLIIPIDYLMRSISISKQSKVPWKQLFKKAPIW